jgi:hypothetical protein
MKTKQNTHTNLSNRIFIKNKQQTPITTQKAITQFKKWARDLKRHRNTYPRKYGWEGLLFVTREWEVEKVRFCSTHIRNAEINKHHKNLTTPKVFKSAGQK